MKKRNILLILLVFIGVFTFLDRIDISLTGAIIITDLGLTSKHVMLK